MRGATQAILDDNAAATARLAAAIAKEEARIAAAREALRSTEEEDAHLAEIAASLATSMQDDLKDVLPLLAKAEQAVNGLDKADLYEIRSFAKPPSLVLLVMEAVCTLLGAKPDWESAKKVCVCVCACVCACVCVWCVCVVCEYARCLCVLSLLVHGSRWCAKSLLFVVFFVCAARGGNPCGLPAWCGGQVLSDATFVTRLLRFDRDNVPEPIIKRLQKYITNPDFKPDIVKSHSMAARSLCMWVRAMETYAQVRARARARAGRCSGVRTSCVPGPTTCARAIIY
jgi:hypothetical protein